LLRGRSLALIGQQEDGAGSATEIQLTLPSGVEARRAEGLRMVELSIGRDRPRVRLIPLGLSMHERSSDGGSITIEGDRVVFRWPGSGLRRWASILACWGKAPTAWRRLTVSERSRACPAGVAEAVRVAWGSSEDGLIVYRSLAKPALRAFLGHQTGARFLIGAFNSLGDVRPILKIDE
jgi:hypothetical protein